MSKLSPGQRSKVLPKDIPLSRVIVGPRRRKKLGAMAVLIRSIEEKGLINPITIRSDNVLVTGFRRLEAFRRLKKRSIPARNWGDLSDEELHEIELDENEAREDLTGAERSEELLRKIEAIEFENAKDLCSTTEHKSKPAHRPKEPTSDRQVAETLKVSPQTVAATRAHVDAFDRYPFMRDNWGKMDAIAGAKTLDDLRAPVRKVVASICAEFGVPMKAQKIMLENVPKFAKAKQDEIVKLYSSGRPHQHSSALRLAMKLPPAPDPAMAFCDKIRGLAKMGKSATELAVLRPRFDEILKIAAEILSTAREDLKKR